MWVRGLKLSVKLWKNYKRSVAPYVGAWIETLNYRRVSWHHLVAPYVGAWIETLVVVIAEDERLASRTLCGCVD